MCCLEPHSAPRHSFPQLSGVLPARPLSSQLSLSGNCLWAKGAASLKAKRPYGQVHINKRVTEVWLSHPSSGHGSNTPPPNPQPWIQNSLWNQLRPLLPLCCCLTSSSTRPTSLPQPHTHNNPPACKFQSSRIPFWGTKLRQLLQYLKT